MASSSYQRRIRKMQTRATREIGNIPTREKKKGKCAEKSGRGRGKSKRKRKERRGREGGGGERKGGGRGGSLRRREYNGNMNNMKLHFSMNIDWTNNARQTTSF